MSFNNRIGFLSQQGAGLTTMIQDLAVQSNRLNYLTVGAILKPVYRAEQFIGYDWYDLQSGHSLPVSRFGRREWTAMFTGNSLGHHGIGDLEFFVDTHAVIPLIRNLERQILAKPDVILLDIMHPGILGRVRGSNHVTNAMLNLVNTMLELNPMFTLIGMSDVSNGALHRIKRATESHPRRPMTQGDWVRLTGVNRRGLSATFRQMMKTLPERWRPEIKHPAPGTIPSRQ